MIALPVSLKLAMSWSVTSLPSCDTRSDRLRAASVTLRLDAMAEENSTSPKNIVSINGAMNANSIAALARRSRMKRPIRLRGRYESLRMASSPGALRFDVEGHCGRKQPLAAGPGAVDVGDVVAEAGNDERPLIVCAHHQGAVRARRRRDESEAGIVVGAVGDRICEIDGLVGRVIFDVVLDAAAAAAHQHGDASAKIRFELLLLLYRGQSAVLQLMGKDWPRAVLDGALQHLAGEKDEAGLDDGEKECEERHGDEREFNRGRTAVVAAEPAENSCQWG